MSVENDGLPFDESAAYDVPPADTGVAGHTTDPPALTTADQPTQVLPVQPPAGPPAPADSTTDGSVTGDLFDGKAGDRRAQ